MSLRDPLGSQNDGEAGLSPSSTSGGTSKKLSLGVPRSRTAAAASNRAGLSGNTDDAVRQTDSDALISRLSAQKLGYLPAEPYSQEFLTANSGPGTWRRSPLINIGTYLRCSSIDAMVGHFLSEAQTPAQIVSIGAGSDSRYWRLMSSGSKAISLAHYLEIDFAENTRLKMSRVSKSELLRSLVHQVSDTDAEVDFSSAQYSLRAADVRRLPSHEAEVERVFGMLDPAAPTLILFECVLSYIDAVSGDSLISLLSHQFHKMQAVVYDIGLAGDADGSDQITRFGKVMLQNLEARHLTLPGAHAYPNMASQARRFSHLRPTKTSASLFTIWQDLDHQQRSR